MFQSVQGSSNLLSIVYSQENRPLRLSQNSKRRERLKGSRKPLVPKFAQKICGMPRARFKAKAGPTEVQLQSWRELSDEAKAMLQDRDMCMNMLVGSDDIHMGQLLENEDKTREAEKRPSSTPPWLSI